MERVKDCRAAIWEEPMAWRRQERSAQKHVIWTIYRRELQELGEGFRFRSISLLIIVAMVLSALVHASRYEREIISYQDAWQAYVEEVDAQSIKTLVDTRYPVLRPPWKLAFLVDGGQRTAPDFYQIKLSYWDLPELGSRQGIEDRLQAAEALDWAFLIRVVLSMGAFLLGYDAICGIRQRTTLKVVLSYSLDRWQVICAKILALWTCVAVPFLLGAALGVMLLWTTTTLPLTQLDLFKTTLVVFLGLWAALLFVVMAVLVSLYSRESGRSLTLLTLIWVVLVVVIPAASSLLARQLLELPPEWQIKATFAAIHERASSAMDGPVGLRSREVGVDDDYEMERRTMDMFRTRYEEQMIEMGKILADRFRQAELARRLALISPMASLQELAEGVVGSGIQRDRTFLEEARAFRLALEEHVTALDLRDAESPHVLYVGGLMSETLEVDADELPLFEFGEVDFRRGLRSAFFPASYLCFLTTLLFLALLVAFAGYDVR